MNVPTFNEIWDRILSKKIIQKNKQYGSSIENPLQRFNRLSTSSQHLINVRLDDKLSRIQNLEDTDPKYWSEVEEIIAYLMWKLYLKEEEERFDKKESCDCGCDHRHEGDTFESTKNLIELINSKLPDLGLRRLPSGERRRLREEDFQ